MQLDRRSNTILQLVIEAYIQNAQPVSSAAVARANPELGLSSATIRAVMAELESVGLLEQPHTSAGRIPTQRGLRTYLDSCVSHKLRPWDRTHLEATVLGIEAKNMPALLGQTLSSLSGHMAVIAVPRFVGTHLKEVGLVRCGVGRILAYFVSPHGLVQQKLLLLDFDVTADELQRVQNFLNERLGGRTLGDVRELLKQELRDAEASRDALQARAANIGVQILPDDDLEVLVEGTAQLLEHAEFNDLHTLRALLRAIEEKSAVLQLLDHLLDTPGVQVMLGSDHAMRDLPEMSCVGCAWTGPNGARTAVSLFGPTRMDYGRLMPLVQYATRLVGRVWEEL